MADGNWYPLFAFLIVLFVLALIISLVVTSFTDLTVINPEHPTITYLDAGLSGTNFIQAYSNFEVTEGNSTNNNNNATLLDKIISFVTYPILFFTTPIGGYSNYASSGNLTFGQRITTNLISSISPLSFLPTTMKTFLHNQLIVISYIPDFLFYPLVILGSLALIWTVTKLILP